MENELVPRPQTAIESTHRVLSLNILNIMPGLPERGKIKIGMLSKDKRQSSGGGEWQAPMKLDHFRVTTLDRDPADNNFFIDKEIHALPGIGDKPKALPIYLPYEDLSLNFQSRYACYKGKTLWCSGDGKCALRINDATKLRDQVQCPCGRQEPTYTGTDKCKMAGKLSCIIAGANAVGGVWVYRTAGFHSTVGITSSLAYIQLQTGGHLARIPLQLVLRKRIGTDPKTGKSVNIYVVCIDFHGSEEDLQKKVLDIVQKNAVYYTQLANVETETKKLLSVEAGLINEAADITEEFYPEDETDPPRLAQPTAAQSTPSQAQVQPEQAPAGKVKRTRGKGKTAQSAPDTPTPPVELAPAVPVIPVQEPPADNPAPQMSRPAGAEKINLF